jgi:tRNA (mo5U34)-methyltransferase
MSTKSMPRCPENHYIGHEAAAPFPKGVSSYNALRGAKYLKDTLSSQVNINDIDLDSQFKIDPHYDMIFFLGILYHLKNPYYALETRSKRTDVLFVSTKIARFPREGGPDISDFPMAYLLDPTESNNDATNYWVFTEPGLKRLFSRTGWSTLAFRTTGDQFGSNPQDPAHNQRAFAILRNSRPK